MVTIKIGVSACLLGEKVRYDGGHKLNRLVADTLQGRFTAVPVCPEVEAGLSIPREPMQLCDGPEGPRLIVISNGNDLTAVMNEWATKKAGMLRQEELCGFILKCRSPSCAIDDADLFSSSGEKKGETAGLFIAQLVRHHPQVPMIDEEDLADGVLRNNFMEQAFACHRELRANNNPSG